MWSDALSRRQPKLLPENHHQNDCGHERERFQGSKHPRILSHPIPEGNMRGDGKPGRGGDEQEQGLRRLAALRSAIARVQRAYRDVPQVKEAMAALRKELGL